VLGNLLPDGIPTSRSMLQIGLTHSWNQPPGLSA
jgi:hypothetical protein